ncbi:ribbon-helix-helix domain-containing protein [Bradyrhizobium erythrophlei]|nr:ribbon-helix-helix domain-containing protein [Bradyrhizobium erythrophlei]
MFDNQSIEATMGRKPKTTGPRARDPGAFKSVLVRINADGWRALKMLAIENDATLNALAVEAFNDLLKKHGKRQLVENPLLD